MCRTPKPRSSCPIADARRLVQGKSHILVYMLRQLTSGLVNFDQLEKKVSYSSMKDGGAFPLLIQHFNGELGNEELSSFCRKMSKAHV
jgi:hypothetical protein